MPQKDRIFPPRRVTTRESICQEVVAHFYQCFSGENINLLFEININVLASMSFALTDTDQYSAMQDVYLKGRIFLDKRPL